MEYMDLLPPASLSRARLARPEPVRYNKQAVHSKQAGLSGTNQCMQVVNVSPATSTVSIQSGQGIPQ